MFLPWKMIVLLSESLDLLSGSQCLVVFIMTLNLGLSPTVSVDQLGCDVTEVRNSFVPSGWCRFVLRLPLTVSSKL